jgi:hypothetical protein
VFRHDDLLNAALSLRARCPLDAWRDPDGEGAVLSVLLPGGIVTTVNPLDTVEELSRQLKDAGAA